MPIASAWSGATAPVTSVIAFEGAARLQEHAGDYSDMLRQRGAAPATAAKQHPLERSRRTRAKSARPPLRAPGSTQRELERLIDRIEVLMEEIRRLEGELADPDLFRRDPEAFAACTDRLARAQPNWKGAEERWLGLASHREQVV
jgi:ABC transport system ATP-binding/permease protein